MVTGLDDKKYREVVGNNGDQAIDLKKSAIGTSVEGTYLGVRTIPTQFGENNIYSFENDEGSFSVYGFTDLAAKMANVEFGADVRLTYNGKETINSKKRGVVQIHRVRVEVAS